MIKNTRIVIALFSMFMVNITEAALINRGGGLIYDTTLDITWLQDANYALTSGYDSDGKMNWDDSMTWAANLNYYDSIRNVTYDDWRLPSVTPVNSVNFIASFSTDASTSWGKAIGTTNGLDGGWRDINGDPTSEMGHMFYVNFGLSSGDALSNTFLFNNIQTATQYWSSAEVDFFTPGTFSNAFDFHFVASDPGAQDPIVKGASVSAWAVRDGDVASMSAVPAPGAAWLFCAGLIGLAGYAKRK